MTGNASGQGRDGFSGLVVAGPTASGKSALALAIAEAFHGTVINADSMQVYADLRILTARPSPAEEARAPHRLYGVLPAAETCSAARWRTMALAEIAAARAAGRLPVLCGGTGLYLKALMEGLSPVPAIPPALRRRLRARLATEGPAALRAELARRDPTTAARLRPGDRQRILRALEVLEATGRPLDAWHADADAEGRAGPRLAVILVLPPRDVLYAAIDARFREMMAAGALAEVARLKTLGLDPELPAMKALGVPELLRHLAGEVDLDTAVAAAQQASRRYAKRQTTWFRHQIISDLTLHEKFSEQLKEEIFSFIRDRGLTPAS